MTAEEWLGGKTCGPKMINLAHGFVPAAQKEFITSAPEVVAAPAPTNEREFQDAFNALKKETDEMKIAITAKDTRIRQLEAQLSTLQQ